jgi:hypothetical protein
MTRLERAMLALTLALLPAVGGGLIVVRQEAAGALDRARASCERDVVQLRGAWIAVALEVAALKREASR